jgi:phosphoribosyl-AMP cyclohydrolase
MHHATRTPNLKWNEQGLLPAIIQESNDGTVLMLGWMNADSLQLTQERGEVVFWSRSRQQLWHKGETSGNVLKVVSIHTDCDQDALLIRATPAGPTCHTGERSCFFEMIEVISE